MYKCCILRYNTFNGLMAQLVRAPPCHGGGRGFESRLGRSGSLAQLGEHLPYKQRVTGSSPVTSTCISFWCRNAGVAELADAQDLKSCCSDTVPVRFRSPAFIERALDKSVIIDEKKLIEYVCVAQLDRALGYGPRCREFESSRPHNLKLLEQSGSFFARSYKHCTPACTRIARQRDTNMERSGM